MPDVLQHTVPLPVAPRTDRNVERRARGDLRRQIASLEGQLAELFATSFPRKGIGFGVRAAGGPRVLGIAELEQVRDALAMRLRDAQTELSARVDVEDANRVLVERMIAEPDRYRWVRVSNDDVGEPGCKHWHSRPRMGILGMLLGWWRVKLSSGCPLAEGRSPRSERQHRGKESPAPAATIVELATV